MNDDRHPHEEHHSSSAFNWILIGFLVVAGYFLAMEHKAHLSGVLYYLPYLLLLACPFMHLFMHHGHGGHGGHGEGTPQNKDKQGEQK